MDSAEKLSDKTLQSLGLAYWHAINGKQDEIDFSAEEIMDIGRLTHRAIFSKEVALQKAQESFSENKKFIGNDLF